LFVSPNRRDMAKQFTNFSFTDLAQSMPDDEDMPRKHKPFDGMAVGEFTDMYGRRAKFKREEMPEYVANTKAILASTVDSSGEVVGLPIDTMNHDHREAAGWLVDVELGESKDVILFTPRWNDMGMGMITGDIARFFSPTVNLENKSIEGGSLTNWPATRDEKTGKILLRPIELSRQMFELTDESLPDRIQRIARAFRQTFRDSYDAEYSWPVDVFEGYVICEMGEKLYRVDFKETDEGLEFAEFDKWVEVKRSYVEAAMRQFKKFVSGLFKPESDVSNGGGDAPDQTETGVIEMELTEQELTDRITNAVSAALATQKPAPVQKPAADLSALLDVEGLSEEAKKQRKAELAAYIASQRQVAELEWRSELARHAHESKMAELANRAVGGSDEAPRGFRVAAEELKAHLMKMDPDEAKFWTDLMAVTQEKGLMDFGERGHSRVLQGSQALPDSIKANMRSWLSVAGNTVEDFFKLNAVELGSMADYNLAEFQPKEK
jgi:hypothetical protein